MLLCKGLCRLLGQAGSLKLLNECRERLLLDSAESSLKDAFASIATESGVPAMALAPADWQLFVKQTLGDTVATFTEMEFESFP